MYLCVLDALLFRENTSRLKERGRQTIRIFFFSKNFRLHQGWIYTTIESILSKWLDDKRAAFDTRSRVIGLKRNSAGLDKLVTGYIWQYTTISSWYVCTFMLMSDSAKSYQLAKIFFSPSPIFPSSLPPLHYRARIYTVGIVILFARLDKRHCYRYM